MSEPNETTHRRLVMPPKCDKCHWSHSTDQSCIDAANERSRAQYGPQKQPASLARLKAEVQQVLATINELEPPCPPQSKNRRSP